MCDLFRKCVNLCTYCEMIFHVKVEDCFPYGLESSYPDPHLSPLGKE